MEPMFLYHWTHKDNLRSIWERGLDPEFAPHEPRRVWACEESRVGELLGHVAKRHTWYPDTLALIRILAARGVWEQTNFLHLWKCGVIITGKNFRGCKLTLLGDWVPVSKAAYRNS